MLIKLIFVASGGAIGASIRFLVGIVCINYGLAGYYQTIFVNIVGSFLIGVLIDISVNLNQFNNYLLLFLSTGILGGFTTYSTFNYQFLNLIKIGNYLDGLILFFITTFGSLLFGVLGIIVANIIIKNS